MGHHPIYHFLIVLSLNCSQYIKHCGRREQRPDLEQNMSLRHLDKDLRLPGEARLYGASRPREMSKRRRVQHSTTAVVAAPAAASKAATAQSTAQPVPPLPQALLEPREAAPLAAAKGLLPQCSLIYTDGACSFNGKRGAQAGFGVYFVGDALPRIAEPLAGPIQTNVRGEWTAVLRALQAMQAFPAKFTREVTIAVDYRGILQTLVGDGKTSPPWIVGWQARAHPRTGVWTKRDGSRVANQDLIQAVWAAWHAVAQTHRITWRWVKAHAADAGNATADALAVAGRQSHGRRRGSSRPRRGTRKR